MPKKDNIVRTRGHEKDESDRLSARRVHQRNQEDMNTPIRYSNKNAAPVRVAQKNPRYR